MARSLVSSKGKKKNKWGNRSPDPFPNDTYRKNKAAVGGATLNQSNLDKAAAGGVLGKDSSGNTVRRAGTITIDSNNNIVDVQRNRPRSAGAGSRYVGTAPNPQAGRPRADIIVPQSVQPVPQAPAGAGAGHTVVTTTSVAPWDFMESPPNPDFVMPDGMIDMQNPQDMRGKPFPFLGIPFELSPYVPHGQAIEDELGEATFLNPTWMAQWGAAIGHTVWNAERAKDYLWRQGEDVVSDMVEVANDPILRATPKNQRDNPNIDRQPPGITEAFPGLW